MIHHADDQPIKTLLILLLSCVACTAQTIHSADKQRSVKLPSQFIVTQEGLKWVQPGVKDPVTVAWERIDLESLAKEEPQIEQARQKVMLTQKSIYVTVPAPVNHYKEFLNLPVKAKFKEKWTAVTSTTSSYDMSVNGYSTTNAAGTYFNATGEGSGSSTSNTRYVDTSRQALSVTMEGFLLSLSKDGATDTHRLVKDLQENGSTLLNVRAALVNLGEVYPKDLEIPRTIAAIDRLTTEKTTSVDAMRQLGKFVEYARNKKVN
jgi:hypothetical protein